jgi:hypothetical protein
MMERPRARRRSRSNGSIYILLLANISADQVASLQAAGVTVHIRLVDSPEEYAAMLSTGAPFGLCRMSLTRGRGSGVAGC